MLCKGAGGVSGLVYGGEADACRCIEEQESGIPMTEKEIVCSMQKYGCALDLSLGLLCWAGAPPSEGRGAMLGDSADGEAAPPGDGMTCLGGAHYHVAWRHAIRTHLGCESASPMGQEKHLMCLRRETHCIRTGGKDKRSVHASSPTSRIAPSRHVLGPAQGRRVCRELQFKHDLNSGV